MPHTAKIDEKDIRILRILIKDARVRLKDIAKECGLSSVSVLNRIKSLKRKKIITGAMLFPNISEIGLPLATTIGVIMDGNKEDEALRLIGEKTHLVEPSVSIGKYDLCALVFAENISELNRTAQAVKKEYGAREVALNIWSGRPHMVFENINLQPKNGEKNGQA